MTSGKAAYKALMTGGSSGFNAVFGGGRSEDGQYARLKAHGFYWTASEIDPGQCMVSTTLVRRAFSIVKTMARSREHFPFGVSGSDNLKSCLASY